MQAKIEMNAADRTALAAMLMRLFAHWQLSTQEQLALLGLLDSDRTALRRYRMGSPLAQQRDLIERAGHLLAIHKNLRLLFPNDRTLAYRWMTTRNRAFDHHTPADIIGQRGFSGLLMVRAYLGRAEDI